ncbi:amidohydrolase family protein [Robertkochia flava]|uniref:amidohydrolase family protein n=1 Tax=Robertkochia flava TaxID=3447986 RepID=UPI001CC9805B|nr:amidohydrolase family protein [Robertkochia marina]
MKYTYVLSLFSLLFCINFLHSQSYADPVKRFIAVDTAVVAITGVKIIDGTGKGAISDRTLIIQDEMIRDLGHKDSIVIPEGALVISGEGKTVIPGLVMMHEHIFYSNPFENWFSVDQMSFSFPRLYLAGGVTTMRTAGSIQPETDLNLKKWIEAGKMTGPRMDVTSPFIEREGYEIAELGFVSNPEEVRKMVRFWADRGVTSFKLYNHITREDLKACVAEAHKLGMKVTGHLCSITYMEASNWGIDNLEHGFMVSSDFLQDKKAEVCDPFKAREALLKLPENSPQMQELIDLLIKNKTAITTTPVVMEPYTNHEIIPGGGDEALAPQIFERVKQQYDRMQNRDSSSVVLFRKNLSWLKRFYDKGGHLMAGTDPTGAGRTVAGYANQRTVEILVEHGFPLGDAIKIVTLNGAAYLDMASRTGSLEKGKWADLILIDGDLEEDIRNIRNMELVFKSGVGFDSAKLFESVEGKVGIN